MTFKIHDEVRGDRNGTPYEIILRVDKHTPRLIDWIAYRICPANDSVIHQFEHGGGYMHKASALRAARRYVDSI